MLLLNLLLCLNGIHSMNFSQQTSSGYVTSFTDEGRQESRREQTPTSHGSQHRYCLECGCYLEAISREITDLRKDNKRLCQQIMEESVSGARS